MRSPVYVIETVNAARVRFVFAENKNDKLAYDPYEHNICTYCESCTSMVDAFITSRFTTGPIRILAYCKRMGE